MQSKNNYEQIMKEKFGHDKIENIDEVYSQLGKSKKIGFIKVRINNK